MIDERWAYVGAAIYLAGSMRYAWNTLKGRTNPNRVTWAIWTFVPMLAFVAMRYDGVSWAGSAMTLSVAVGPLMVLLASFVNKQSVWRITKRDYVCGAISLSGLLLWLFLRSAPLAIFIAIAAELFGFFPTLIKSWQHPESESYASALAAVTNAGITLLTITVWDVKHAAFSLYIFTAMMLMTVLVKYRLGPRLMKGAASV